MRECFPTAVSTLLEELATAKKVLSAEETMDGSEHIIVPYDALYDTVGTRPVVAPFSFCQSIDFRHLSTAGPRLKRFPNHFPSERREVGASLCSPRAKVIKSFYIALK